MRPILILTLRRHRLTGTNRRRQTPHTPLITLSPITVIVVALPEPKSLPAHGRRARVAIEVRRGQGVQTARHGAYPGRIRGRVAARVGAGAGGVVARVGRAVSVEAVAVLGVGDYHAGEAGEGETSSAAAAATTTKTTTAAANAASFWGRCRECKR